MSETVEAEKTVPAAEELVVPAPLESLSKLIAEKPEALATGSEEFRKVALDATKFVYDLALDTEKDALGRVNELLSSLNPSHAPQTRSQTAAHESRKRKRDALDGLSSSFPAPRPVPLMQETPLGELLVDGMSDEQVWAELELRAQGVCEMLNYALDGELKDMDEEAEDGEGASGADARTMELDAMKQALIAQGFDSAELEGMEFERDEDDDSEGSEDDEDDDESEFEDEEDDDDTDEEADYGEGVEELRDPSDEDDEDEDELRLDEPSFLSAGQRTLRFKRKPGGHPVLDDGFFDLAAFNAEIEAAESKNVSRGRLSKDDEDDSEDDAESVDLFAPVDETAVFEEEDLENGGELFYKDFFDPPSQVAAKKAKKPPKDKGSSPPKGRVRFSDEVRVKKIKAKGKNLPVSAMFYEEEEEDEDDAYQESEDDEEDDDDDEDGEDDIGMLEEEDDPNELSPEEEDVSMESEDDMATIRRIKDDLLADDEEEEQQDMTTHEKRLAALREEIASLEAENVGKKDWTLMGEATSRSRPQNSLLEEDLEFERVMKSVPVITEDVVHSLEERIKARIMEGQFDDVVRKRPVDDKPFLPSRFFELQDTKSKQSLAEIYEDDYTASQNGGVSGEDRDGKLKKEHQEIEKLWETICGKLDALCNAHFTPKAPKATITSVSNVAAATLESALPTTKATTTMLAPEEVYAPTPSDLRARSELTPVEKRALRNKRKKAGKKARDAIDKSVQKFGRPKGVGDVKRQKEAALKTLVKNGKGVTVVGKKSKELEGKSKRGKS